MMSIFTASHKENLHKNAQQWIKSSEGRETLQKALQEAREITIRLQEERKVDSKSLQEPFTV